MRFFGHSFSFGSTLGGPIGCTPDSKGKNCQYGNKVINTTPNINCFFYPFFVHYAEPPLDFSKIIKVFLYKYSTHMANYCLRISYGLEIWAIIYDAPVKSHEENWPGFLTKIGSEVV